jgi:hypothetical protein
MSLGGGTRVRTDPDFCRCAGRSRGIERRAEADFEFARPAFADRIVGMSGGAPMACGILML